MTPEETVKQLVAIAELYESDAKAHRDRADELDGRAEDVRRQIREFEAGKPLPKWQEQS